MTRTTNYILALVASIGVMSIASQATADVWHHLDEQAVRIENKVRALTTETLHYRHTSEYQHMIADTRELSRMASNIHGLVHNSASLNRLAAYVREMDRTFHHVEDLFDRVERLSAHGVGHVHGETIHVRKLLNTIENSIHHLQSDLASLQQQCANVQIAARPVTSSYYNSSRGINNSFHGYNVHNSVRSAHSGYNSAINRSHSIGHGSSYNSGMRYQGRNFGIDSSGISIGRGNTHFRISF